MKFISGFCNVLHPALSADCLLFHHQSVQGCRLLNPLFSSCGTDYCKVVSDAFIILRRRTD